MSAPPVFPTLPGQGWSVHKKPTFASVVSSHVSGREVRAALYLNPVWQFELTFDGLDGTAAGAYGGLGGSSLQSLMGLFLQCPGAVPAVSLLRPDRLCRQRASVWGRRRRDDEFRASRTLGGFSEPVTQPFARGADGVGGSGIAAGFRAQQSDEFFRRPHQQRVTKTNATVTSGAGDPLGGAGAQTIAASAANGIAYQGAAVASGNFVSSVWVRRNAGVGAVYLRTPGNMTTTINVDSTWRRFSTSGPPAVNRVYLALQLANAGDAVDVWAPQVEQSLVATAGPYFQTLASDYYGGPWITAAGGLVDPSAYTIANGIVSFATAPASGAALAWTGYFGFLCRFDGDDLDFEQFMANLWRADSVKFRSLRAQ